MPAGYVDAGWAEDNYHSGGHVFATVLAHAFDDGQRPAVAHRESFASPACDVKLARRSAVEGGVPGQQIAAQRGISAGFDGDCSAA